MWATAGFSLALASILLAITWIDWRRLVIPDALNLCLAVTGCMFQASASPIGAWWLHAGMGASVFAVFWLLRRAHQAATGRIGLGLGDVKMAGAAAIWIDPWNLPLLVFAASFSALAFTLLRELAAGGEVVRERRQPFGPFLAAALAMTWAGERWMNIALEW